MRCIKLVNNVGIISSSPGGITGGSEVSVGILINSLAARGINVYVASYPMNLQGLDKCSNVTILNDGGSIFPIELHAQPVTLIPRIFFLMRQLEKLGVEIIHLYNVYPMPAVSLYKGFGGRCKTIGQLNNYGGICPAGNYICNGANRCNYLNRYSCLKNEMSFLTGIFGLPYSVLYPGIIKMMKSLDGYIALSEAVKSIYVANGYIGDRIRVIPNIYEGAYQPFTNNDTVFTILYVGSLSENKGVQDLINAFSELITQRPDCKLLIVGDGPLRSDLENLAFQKGVAGRVTFSGKVPHSEVWKYYRQSSVFVHPGHWNEPFGRTLLEAISYGLPCVVSDIGAPPEVVGSAGLVFPRGNIEVLNEKIKLLYDNNRLRVELSKNCKYVLEKYNKNSIIAEIIQYYDEIIQFGIGRN